MTKKLFHSKAHRERAQPANRSRFGLLEKKKDYVLRARDFQSKKKRLQAMKVRAAYKNPDEFYFGMVKSRVDKATGKVRQEAEHEKLAGDVIKLMKSQDLKHIEELIRVNEAKLETFKAEHAITIGTTGAATAASGKGKHVKFVEDDSELADLILDARETEDESNENENENEEPNTLTPTLNPIIEEYQARLTRLQTLKLAQKKLQQEKLAAAKGRKRKVGTDTDGVAIYKFEQERKK